MQGSSAAVPFPEGEPTPVKVEPVDVEGDKGLKSGALGLVSSIVIGVASTAPAYSLAATLGFIVAVGGIGLKSPAIMIVSFIPMLLIAGSYYYLNRVDPDCGTTFTWVTRSFGPRTGWVTGWIMVAADVIVMASLAQIAGSYFFLLFGADGLAASTFWTTLAGTVFIVGMTVIAALGIQISARIQWFLLAAEVTILVAFSITALVKVYGSAAPATSIKPSASWFVPNMSLGALAGGILLALFIYWGWDTAVSVNEETERKSVVPGIGAVVSTIALVAIYVLTTTAAQAFRGPDFLAKNADDVLSPLGTAVFGSSTLDKLLILAVLSSAVASTLTTILPGTRTTLSMAVHGAIPKAFGKVSPRYPDPSRRYRHLRHRLSGLVRRPHGRQPERAVRQHRRPRPDDRLLLRHHRLRGADLLPAPDLQRRQEVPDARALPAPRRARPHLGPDRVAGQPLVSGQLRVGHLVVRRRSALRPRRGLHRGRHRPDAGLVRLLQDVLLASP